MNTEQERAAFEAWYQHHHGDRDVYALDEFGEYADKRVQSAFNVWQARAALQSQDREDSERLDFIEKAWFYQNPDGVWSFGFNECWDAGQHNSLRDAIDHARRSEGDGE